MLRLEHSFTAMGGPCRLRIDSPSEALAEKAVAAAVAEVERLESRYSRYREDSLLTAINRGAGSGTATVVDAETHTLLNYADTVWRESDGLFDISSGVLRQAWDFKQSVVPSQEQLDALLPLVGWDKVERSERSVYLPRAGMELDLGGVVKEYACDSVAAVLRAHDIHHALTDLGGDMLAIGPQADGTPWRVAIRDPRGTGAMASIELMDAAIASSGDYERGIDINGERLGHILDPHSGWPVKGLIAASVVAPQCLVAGSAATIALLQSEADGLAWLRQLGLTWIAVDRQQRVYR
ncbi:FAD:protein FMN transferase [Halioglobus maricola]|uniref:FAD:protein FMN transferase n=1 Tax=Halioglobus maricola TaxID=2601894 RepID=A0A5P9NIE8_9GAMM|nr:FAD:protein FMN transferase [Halioglobus maricola]QFU75562.1 FAD:protein FMN transferase [Halioglobus maricola]